MKFLVPIAFAVFSSAGMASAATFDNSVDFFSNNIVDFTETFSEFADTTVGTTGPVTLASGLEVSSESNDLFIAATGQSTNTSVAIGSNTPSSDSLTLSLGGIYTALGLDIYQNNVGGAQTGVDQTFTLTTFLGGILVDTYVTAVESGGGSYFGFNGSGMFDTVNVFSNSDLFEVVDNVSAGNLSAVPLPASGLLLLAGFGALGAARRSKSAS